MSEIIPFNEMKEMTKLMSKSIMLPKALQEKPYDIFVILQMGMELGLKPMQSLNGINVIQGKPTIAPQTMLALIYQRIPSAYVKFYKKGENYCCDMARSKNDEIYTAEWGEEKAKAMQLISKDNWKKQFENMCKWRCISEAARVVFPDVIQGFYTPEEIDENIEVKDETKNEPPRQGEIEVKTEGITIEQAKAMAKDVFNSDVDDKVINETAKKEKNESYQKELKVRAMDSLHKRINEVCKDDKNLKKYIIDSIGYKFKTGEYIEKEYKEFEARITDKLISEYVPF